MRKEKTSVGLINASFFLKGNIFELCMRGKMILIREMMERMRKEKTSVGLIELTTKN